MKKLYLGTLLLCIFVLLNASAIAQDDVPKTKFLVWEVQVTPEQHSKLLEAVKFQHEFLKEQNYPYAGYVNYTNDGLFYYSTPIQSFADIDEMNAHDKKLWKEFPEKQKEIWAKFEGNFKSVGSIIIEHQPELSVMAAEGSPAPPPQSFRFFEKFELKNGKLMEFTEIAKRYKALRLKHGFTDPYQIYYPEFGPNMSTVYLLDDMGTNPSEHYSINSKKWEKFGEEGEQLMKDFIAIVERVETHLGTMDYEASYIPSK